MDKLNLFSGYGHWLVRLSLAGTFLSHGMGKFPMAEMMAKMMDMPLPMIYMLAMMEVAAGVLILYGGIGPDWATRVAGLIIAAVMMGAIGMVHLQNGWSFMAGWGEGTNNMGGAEFQTLVAAIALFFAFKGNSVNEVNAQFLIMLNLIVLLTLCFLPQKEIKHSNMDSNIANRTLNEVLNTYVNNAGRVDYKSIRENPFSLQPFLAFVASVSPQSHPELFPTNDDKKAYWINTYNGLMIQAVIENPKISSVKEIGWGYGVFWRKKFKVGGELLTLNHIEHKILRRQYQDPRIHFAINCASNSCPPIGQRILTEFNLDQQLNDKTREFINNPANVMVDHKKKIIVLSKIFKWYKKDFESGGTTLVEFLNKYRDEPIHSSNYGIKFQDYDWGLNAFKKE